MKALITIIAVIFSASFIISILSAAVNTLLVPTLICCGIALFIYITYQTYLHYFFKSERFTSIKNGIANHIDDCNKLNSHIERLKTSHPQVGSVDYGVAELQDESNYEFKRSNWKKKEGNRYTHNCSATVCKNADSQPFKYLCKYFNIKPNEENLINFEQTLNDFLAVEEGKKLLGKQREELFAGTSSKIPSLITSFSKDRVISELGFEPVDLGDLHFPTYTFKYVSAGGNSSIRTDIRLDVINLEKFVIYLSELIKFRQSIAGQRSLMTAKLREFIKNRDSHTCMTCSNSTKIEPNLLLEIDHILPLSKGGITSEENLQTLCWRCNRSKGSKILTA